MTITTHPAARAKAKRRRSRHGIKAGLTTMTIRTATGRRVAKVANQRAKAQTKAKERAGLGGIEVSGSAGGLAPVDRVPRFILFRRLLSVGTLYKATLACIRILCQHE